METPEDIAILEENKRAMEVMRKTQEETQNVIKEMRDLMRSREFTLPAFSTGAAEEPSQKRRSSSQSGGYSFPLSALLYLLPNRPLQFQLGIVWWRSYLRWELLSAFL